MLIENTSINHILEIEVKISQTENLIIMTQPTSMEKEGVMKFKYKLSKDKTRQIIVGRLVSLQNECKPKLSYTFNLTKVR